MRLWTVLLISHDTDEPRSIALSERWVRVGAAGVVVVLFAAVIGIGTLAARWARADGEVGARGRSALLESGTVPESGELDSLRATVAALYHVLDTIRLSDAELREAAGLESSETALGANRASIALTRASADSLLAGASEVAERLVALADSARVRRRASPKGAPAPGPARTAPR